MPTITSYPTRPIETWKKMKELRRKYNRLGWDAHQQGGFVVVSQMPIHPLLAGIGVWGRRLYGPYFAKAMQDVAVLGQYHATADAKGFPRGEMCSSMHHYAGELLSGDTTVNPWTGEQSPVDFVFESEFCPSAAKTAQFASEQLGVPRFILDMPQNGGETAVEFLAGRMHDAIGFLERTTGKPYDDERLIEGAINFWEQGVIYGRIYETLKAVPAPIDQPTVQKIRTPASTAAHTREVVAFLAEVLAELEERIRDGVSMFGVETVRLSHEGEFMWYADEYVSDLVRRYGGVLVSGNTAFTGGIYNPGADGNWTLAPRFDELGISLRSREDAVTFLARCYALHMPAYRLARLEEKVRDYLWRAQDWHCHGVIYHLDIGCRSQIAGVLEARIATEHAGIPTVTYQSSNCDAMSFSPQHVSTQLESFLERLGRTPIA